MQTARIRTADRAQSQTTNMAELKDEVKEQEQEEDGEGLRMKPWEQHSAVISIPRFDYNAPSSLLHHSRSGFLVTCPISLLNPLSAILFLVLNLYSFEVNYSLKFNATPRDCNRIDPLV
ncbi:hypothetical protein U1Q18_050068 [Sarracenia purpurea var. burkii]